MGGLPGCDQLDKRHIWEHQKANVPATEGNGRNGLDDAFRPNSFQTNLLNIEIGRLIREVVEADAFDEPRREYAGLGVVAKELEPRAGADEKAPVDTLLRVVEIWALTPIAEHGKFLLF